jgi:hypothetical protein
MRTRWAYLAVLLLGGLALVVATQSRDGTGEDAVAADRGSPASSDPVPTNPNDRRRSIRSVDFGEVDQPAEVCAEGLGDVAPPVIRVTQGRSGVIDAVRNTRLTVSERVVYGDVTGDGVENAVVHMVCSYGANGTQHTLQIWGISEGEARIVATITEPPPRVAGPLAPNVITYTVEQDVVEVAWTRHTEDDPNCCPSLATRIRYRVVAGEVVQLGEPRTGPVPTTVA